MPGLYVNTLPDGVTTISGVSVQSSDGATTIIDGTTDVFKIAATGTLSKAFAAGANTSVSTSVTLTALGNGFSTPPALLANSYGSWSAERSPGDSWLVVATSDIWGGDTTTTISLSSGQVVVKLYADAWGAGLGGNTAFCRYYVLIEIGI